MSGSTEVNSCIDVVWMAAKAYRADTQLVGLAGAAGGLIVLREAASYTGGRLWFFSKSPEGDWEVADVLPAPWDDPYSQFGQSAALSEKGGSVVATLPGGGVREYRINHGVRMALNGDLPITVEGRLAVAISGDGQTAAVSGCTPAGERQVEVFSRTKSGWRLAAALNDRRHSPAFGAAVAVSDGGRRIVVGSPGTPQEMVHVFTLSGEEWEETVIWGPSVPYDAEDEGDDDPHVWLEGFGDSVAISADGEILVGAPDADAGDGEVRRFRVSPSGEVTEGAVIAPPEGVLYFGQAIWPGPSSAIVGIECGIVDVDL